MRNLRLQLLRVLWLAPFLLVLAAPAQAQSRVLQGGVVQPLWSQPNANEVDTAAQANGQAGGRALGRHYQLETLRCPPNAAIVGMQISRGDVLDYLQIACAVPQCTGSTCQWSQAEMQWGPDAGGTGGDMQQPMLCNQNSVLTGFTARVVKFTLFDFAADIAPECGLLASAASPDGFYAVTITSDASRAGPTVARSYTPPNATRSMIGPVSCTPNGNASAVSVATADFVLPGQRVVQAVSIYCPANPVAPSPSCKVRGQLSDNAAVAVTMQDFIGYLRGNANPLGGTWGAAVNGQYPTVKNAAGKIVKNYRYVQTPGHPGVIIDMRHFQYVGPLGQGVGGMVEACQAMGGQASAYQRQDFYSNALGEAFNSYKNVSGNSDYAANLQAFFFSNLVFRGANGQNVTNQALINNIVQSAQTMQ
ncbi:MAG TPA: hypothetical protein VKQ29_17655 [Aliidongia sp.]|nr:hypothetical protein [Aliidongia sp.]